MSPDKQKPVVFGDRQIRYTIRMCKLFIVIGLAVILAGAYQYKKVAEFVANSNEVEGVVVEMVGRRGKPMRPIVDWVDHVGETRTLYSNVGSSPPDYFVGERVPILYDPNDPKYPSEPGSIRPGSSGASHCSS